MPSVQISNVRQWLHSTRVSDIVNPNLATSALFLCTQICYYSMYVCRENKPVFLRAVCSAVHAQWFPPGHGHVQSPNISCLEEEPRYGVYLGRLLPSAESSSEDRRHTSMGGTRALRRVSRGQDVEDGAMGAIIGRRAGMIGGSEGGD